MTIILMAGVSFVLVLSITALFVYVFLWMTDYFANKDRCSNCLYAKEHEQKTKNKINKKKKQMSNNCK